MNLKELAMDLKRKMKKLAMNLQKRTICEGIISLTFA